MKSIKTVAFWMTIICIISCDKDNNMGVQNNGPNTSNIVFITQDISEPTTWSGDSIYVIQQWNFFVNNTLTIEAGTIVKFTDAGTDLTLGDAGTLIAKGAAGNPIVFTSYKDDSFGGDTNEDGDNSSPSNRDWGSINVNGHNGSKFEFCIFYYGGRNDSYTYTLNVDGNNITVTDCVFGHNYGDYSNYEGALNATEANNSIVIQRNHFFDNGCPMAISTAIDIDDSNTFDTNNQYNGILINSYSDFETNITWEETEVAFVIPFYKYVETNITLNLGDGVVLKFWDSTELLLHEGLINISNYNGDGVFFTSIKDDNLKGDTNGDGNTTSPAQGDWEGISYGLDAWHNWSNILYSQH